MMNVVDADERNNSRLDIQYSIYLSDNVSQRTQILLLAMGVDTGQYVIRCRIYRFRQIIPYFFVKWNNICFVFVIFMSKRFIISYSITWDNPLLMDTGITNDGE